MTFFQDLIQNPSLYNTFVHTVGEISDTDHHMFSGD